MSTSDRTEFLNITGLENKTVLVTGSSKGIGRGVAITSAKAGANIVINHRDSASDAEAVRQLVENLGRQALVIQADAGIESDVDAMFDEAIDRFGGVDVAVHSAYYSYREFAVDMPLKEWQRTIDVSLSGAFLMARRTARDLIRRNSPGSIIFIGSIQAIRNPPKSAAYNSAKNGLRGLTYTLASELGPHKIRVNLIEPGWIDTPGERSFATDDEIKAGAADLPWKRLGTAEEIGNGVLYLASDMGSYVSGETLRIDAATWLPRAIDRL